MEFVGAVDDFPTIIVSLLVGITVLVIVYISSLFKSHKEEIVKSKLPSFV